MSIHHGLIPETHTRTSNRISKNRARRTFYIYIEDLTRSSYSYGHPRSVFIQTTLIHGICKIFMHGRLTGCQLDLILPKVFSLDSCMLVHDHARTSCRNSPRSSQHLPTRTSTRPGQDFHILRTCKTVPWNPCKIVIDHRICHSQRTHEISLPKSQRIS